jgi:hypothetical protein
MLRNLVFVASITLILFTREATTAPSAESGPAQAAASGAATSGDFAGFLQPLSCRCLGSRLATFE